MIAIPDLSPSLSISGFVLDIMAREDVNVRVVMDDDGFAVIDGDGFVLCPNCDTGGGECDGECDPEPVKTLGMPKKKKKSKKNVGTFVTVSYTCCSKFVFPHGFEPTDDNWFIKWDELYIKDKDGNWRQGQHVYLASEDSDFKRHNDDVDIEEDEYGNNECETELKHTIESLPITTRYG